MPKVRAWSIVKLSMPQVKLSKFRILPYSEIVIRGVIWVPSINPHAGRLSEKNDNLAVQYEDVYAQTNQEGIECTITKENLRAYSLNSILCPYACVAAALV